jgi:hypothetical protein
MPISGKPEIGRGDPVFAKPTSALFAALDSMAKQLLRLTFAGMSGLKFITI